MSTNTLDLRHIPRDATGKIAVGESGRHSTSQNLFSDDTSHDVVLAPKHPREKIWEFVAMAGRAVSRAEISKGCGYKKAPWINAHIESLVSDGWLIRSQSMRPNGVIMYWYKAIYKAGS